ncbi:MAG: hypothetical protein NT033_06210 [Candidatus Omnitrophica bacterium]|nr:hypothetical protein [Candidatus Omnitrophota bacterium]
MKRACGWVKDSRCGCGQKKFQWHYADQRSLCAQLLKDTVLAYPIENFGRFDAASRLVVLSVALALYDADIHYAKDKKQDIGILGTSPDGALDANLAYLRDYAQAGRKLGRGNLFIYTLPSSPLAEASIHFGLQGPILYLRNLAKPEDYLLAQAELMVRDKATQAILAVSLGINEATCKYIQGAAG